MLKNQELVALAGYAARVSEMLDVFKDAALCKYKRNVVTTSPARSLPNGNTQQLAEKVIEFNNGIPIIKGKSYDSSGPIFRKLFRKIYILMQELFCLGISSKGKMTYVNMCNI